MGLLLSKIFDPRDKLDKAKRREMAAFAERNGISEIVPTMPATLMRKILRRRGINDVGNPDRVLGNDRSEVTHQDLVDADKAISAEDDLERQWAAGAYNVPSVDDMKIGELRRLCKELGIKISRTDKMDDLREKIRGKDPS